MSGALARVRCEEPARALQVLADALAAEGSEISPFVVSAEQEPSLGMLVAAGPRCSGAPGTYALIVEMIREGYLLHYATPRIVRGADADLSLLAGDYLYACGLERLAALGDAVTVGELADLISLSAELHVEGREGCSAPLWLCSLAAIACGPSPDHSRAKAAARALEDGAGELLFAAALQSARSEGLQGELDRAADAIDFTPPRLADHG